MIPDPLHSDPAQSGDAGGCLAATVSGLAIHCLVAVALAFVAVAVTG